VSDVISDHAFVRNLRLHVESRKLVRAY
jgi:hypothetical protein